METLRQVLAFPMFLTAIWLLWVLGAQAGSDSVVAVALGATVLAFGIWLAKKIGSGTAGKAIVAAVILLALVGPIWMTTMSRPAAAEGSLASAPEPGHAAWSPDTVKKLQAENRVIFVDFTARWCVTCQVNKGAMNSAEARKAFADHNVAFLEADWTNRNDEIAQELAKHERAGVPLYLVYPANGGEPAVLSQILTPGEIAKSIEAAAKGATKPAT
jgi:thiol:disulfide interchange protein DsbD